MYLSILLIIIGIAVCFFGCWFRKTFRIIVGLINGTLFSYFIVNMFLYEFNSLLIDYKFILIFFLIINFIIIGVSAYSLKNFIVLNMFLEIFILIYIVMCRFLMMEYAYVYIVLISILCALVGCFVIIRYKMENVELYISISGAFMAMVGSIALLISDFSVNVVKDMAFGLISKACYDLFIAGSILLGIIGMIVQKKIKIGNKRKVCSICKEKIPLHARFCPKCGNAV